MSTLFSVEASPKEILDYWFGPVERLEIPGVKTSMDLWFGGTPAIDEDIARRFLPRMREAALGDLDSWSETPEGTLALILLLDQFSLNVYRDQARSFTHCHLALPYALKALERQADEKLPLLQRVFVYLPLEHAEDIHLQEESLHCYRRLIDLAPENEKAMYEGFYDYAVRHQRVIARFGRYPDRNPILGRPATPDEQAYMDAGGPDF